tara:strand:- start:891 stop:1838 length:948 start_codon:yes stop_codon:yes gene_type:complete
MNENLIKLLSTQIYKQKFSRLDLVVRYAFLESLSKPEIFHERKALYEKMQYKRCGTILHTSGDTFVNEFVKLSNSFQSKGYLEQYPLVVNEHGHLINSSHRAACCLFYNIKKPPSKIVTEWRTELVNKNTAVKSYFMYGREWFENNGFTEEELNFIDTKKLEIMNNVGHYFVFTLWDSSKIFHEEILNKIRQKTEVLSRSKIQTSTLEYNKIVSSIYEIDDIEENRIAKKLENMPNATKLTIIRAHIWNPTFRKKNKNPKVDICVEIEDIKKQIREEYKEKIVNYYYDNIIHAGDNFEHSEHIMRVFNNHTSHAD